MSVWMYVGRRDLAGDVTSVSAVTGTIQLLPPPPLLLICWLLLERLVDCECGGKDKIPSALVITCQAANKEPRDVTLGGAFVFGKFVICINANPEICMEIGGERRNGSLNRQCFSFSLYLYLWVIRPRGTTNGQLDEKKQQTVKPSPSAPGTRQERGTKKKMPKKVKHRKEEENGIGVLDLT